ncbi:hypothetical protein NGRA_0706 [Nosema granulosis]|uniref:Uncharacterized protein n=1 Tax=Nosema granulosis TaxID=83296 RepID=A0A9P6KZB9_9MICR|nr:hypothetical protein NGRA_0706 [Nosema granulosis]
MIVRFSWIFLIVAKEVEKELKEELGEELVKIKTHIDKTALDTINRALKAVDKEELSLENEGNRTGSSKNIENTKEGQKIQKKEKSNQNKPREEDDRLQKKLKKENNEYQDKINSLEAENEGLKAELDNVTAQIVNYSEEIPLPLAILLVIPISTAIAISAIGHLLIYRLFIVV